MTLIAAALCFIIGIIHSFLGEKYIIIRLFRNNNLPKLFGDTYFTKQTIRFAWHITTIAWFGFGYLLYALTKASTDIRTELLLTICGVFAISGLIAFIFSKGKHLSWVIFWSISSLTLYAAISE